MRKKKKNRFNKRIKKLHYADYTKRIKEKEGQVRTKTESVLGGYDVRKVEKNQGGDSRKRRRKLKSEGKNSEDL